MSLRKTAAPNAASPRHLGCRRIDGAKVGSLRYIGSLGMLASRYDILLHPDARTMECPLKISRGVDVNLWKWLFPDTWSDLRSIGNSPLTRLTIAAPFISFIFDLFDNVISIPLLWPYLENFRIGWPRPRL